MTTPGWDSPQERAAARSGLVVDDHPLPGGRPHGHKLVDPRQHGSPSTRAKWALPPRPN